MRFSFIEPFLAGKGEMLSRRLLAAPTFIVPKARGTSDTGTNGRKWRFIFRPMRPCRCDFRGNKENGGEPDRRKSDRRSGCVRNSALEVMRRAYLYYLTY